MTVARAPLAFGEADCLDDAEVEVAPRAALRPRKSDASSESRLAVEVIDAMEMPGDKGIAPTAPQRMRETNRPRRV